MDLSAEIIQVAVTQRNEGGLAETRTSRGVYPATLGGPSGETEREIAKRVTAAASWWLTLPHGTPVEHLDQAIISGQTYQVIYVPPAGASFVTALRVLVAEVGL